MTWVLLASPLVLVGAFLWFVLPAMGHPAELWLDPPQVTKTDPELRPRRRAPSARPRPHATTAHRPLDQLTPWGLRAIAKTLALVPAKKDFAAAGFVPIPKAELGDWRLGPGKDEGHQSYGRYVRAEPNGSKGKRRHLILRRVGPCIKPERAHFEPLRQWMSAFFQRPVRWDGALKFVADGRTRRLTDGTTWRQYPTGRILQRLRRYVPSKAVALLGVTCEDLYPQESWNFVFGMATFRARVGIYSLARLYPSFTGEPWTRDAAQLGLLRALKMLTHETGHMFGLHHCVTFHCIMNGSNGMDETDEAPLHLCPLCLSKLAWNLKLDVRRRYAALARFLRKHGFPDEATWYEGQLKRMAKGTPPKARARRPPSRPLRRP